MYINRFKISPLQIGKIIVCRLESGDTTLYGETQLLAISPEDLERGEMRRLAEQISHDEIPCEGTVLGGTSVFIDSRSRVYIWGYSAVFGKAKEEDVRQCLPSHSITFLPYRV